MPLTPGIPSAKYSPKIAVLRFVAVTTAKIKSEAYDILKSIKLPKYEKINETRIIGVLKVNVLPTLIFLAKNRERMLHSRLLGYIFRGLTAIPANLVWSIHADGSSTF